MSSITVPEGYSYVIAAAISTSYLLIWQTVRVGAARKAAKVAYPQLYAEKAEAEANKAAMKFNCTQRAHQNTLENIPMVLLNTLVMGLEFPIAAASLCGVWTASRVLYTLGYATGDPARRNKSGGVFGSIAGVGLIGGSTYAVVQFIRAGL
ncbi:hypothetical protein JAAARDRAFT_188921 [Jaapia argillacea MUCL 33604]|uniref:Membrane-associated proteins in eicosanoid and glutathione metabolism n=1 Tax=Jaapia argillacea MUCL 33604 TaxID=933084 RepID=A0A067Q8G1_9AGAM|nr:hypothetical protein JAAARDRAFT_188921 [Jaapia argillacea MUCL 33604]